MPTYNASNVKKIFEDHNALAMKATSLGKPVSEFIKQYYANQRDAEIWNTCKRPYKGTVKEVKLVERTGGYKVAEVTFKVAPSEEYGDETTLPTEILGKNKTDPPNRLATKAKNLIGRDVLVYHGYIIDGDSANKRLLDLEPLYDLSTHVPEMPKKEVPAPEKEASTKEQAEAEGVF